MLQQPISVLEPQEPQQAKSFTRVYFFWHAMVTNDNERCCIHSIGYSPDSSNSF